MTPLNTHGNQKMPEIKKSVPKNRQRKPTSTSFTKDNQPNNSSPESRAKAEHTKVLTREIRPMLYEFLREELITPDKNGRPYYQKFLANYMKEAEKDSNSKAAQVVASLILQPDVVEKLDFQTNKLIARDRDFIRYRLDQQLFDKQKEVMRDRITRRKVLMCSRRAGKTEFNARKLIDACIQPNTPAFYIHLNSSNAVAQLWKQVVEAATSIGLDIAKEDKMANQIIFANGSVIYFRGNHDRDDIEKLRGYKARLVIIDEAQSQKHLEYLVEDVLSPLLADYDNSELILTGTPPRRPKTYFEKAYINGAWKSFSWDLRQNPFIPNAEEEIKRICELKGVSIEHSLIQREYLGKIAYDTEAQIFRGYQSYKNEQKRTLLNKKFTNIYIGNDYGWAANNAVIGIAANINTKEAVVYYESKFNKATVTDIVNANQKALEQGRDILMHSGSDLGNIGIYGDTSDQSIIFEMSQTYNMPAYKCYKYDKSMAIEQLAEECRTGRLLVPENGILADEFAQTLYKRDEDDALTNEIDDDNYHPDAIMAMLYASRQWLFDNGTSEIGDIHNGEDE